MALVDNLNIHEGLFGDSQGFDESKWTQDLLKHGYAELAESDPHHKLRAAQVPTSSPVEPVEASAVGNEAGASPDTPSQSPEADASEGLSARRARVRSSEVSQTRVERKHRLDAMAARLTGRSSKRGKKPS